ncbi:hypothetical protein KR018_012468 [Drosophila ironensis]|nr:hypothetical protein KR018_012468 [Drosophila ironensis]
MHFMTQQRPQHQHHKSNSSSSSSLASQSSSGNGTGNGSGGGTGSGSGSGSSSGSRFVALRKSASQGALPKSLATAHSFFLLRPSPGSGTGTGSGSGSGSRSHKRTASLNAASMIKDFDNITNQPTTSSIIVTAAAADSPSGRKIPANANMIPETTTQPDPPLQSQSQFQSQIESQSPQDHPPQCPQQEPDKQEKPKPNPRQDQDEGVAGDRRDSITEEITITTTTINSTLSTKLLTIQEATGSLEQQPPKSSLSSKQSASPPAGSSPPPSAPLANSSFLHDSSGSTSSLAQAATSSTSSPPNLPAATPSISIVPSEASREQPLQSHSVDSNGFTASFTGGGSCTDSPGSRKSSTSSKGKASASQAKLSTSSSGKDEQDPNTVNTQQHRLSDLTPHELSLLRVDREQQVTSSSSTSNEKPAKPSRLSERAKKKSWYNVIYPNYKSRAEDFKKLFKDVPNDERLIVDYSCALQRDILVQGRLYVSQNYVCFHANIFSWETYVSIKWKDVTAITKEKTALVIPNAISISSGKDKYFFATFTSRDKSFLMLFRVWQNTLMNKQFSPQEIWKYVHSSYGEELGLTTDDEDYIDPTLDNDNETDFDFQTAIDDDGGSQSARQSQQSNQSTHSNSQLPQSGNSSASSGGGGGGGGPGPVASASASRASVPRKSKTKYFFNSSKSSANASASGSDNNKTRESSRKLNKKMKQNAKELTLSSVKPAEQSVSVTMTQVTSSSGSNTLTTSSSSTTVANNHSSTGTVTGPGSTQSGSGSDKKSAEKKISTGSSSGAAAAAAAAAAVLSENKLETKRKLSKNHKNAEETVPTDVSDSSDSEGNSVPFVPTTECTSTHEGRQIVHTILPISVDTLFNMLFSKSKFLTDFHAQRKSTDLIMGEWSKNEEGLNVRTVNVTVQLAASVGPKSSKVTEYQTMRECSKPGELYSIDVNSVNAGIPYADSFSVLIHFCLARTVDDHTMLSVHTQIKYKKSIWGVVKGFIEKNTWAGLEDFFGAQLHALQSETCIPPAKGKGRRPRRGTATQIRPLEEAGGTLAQSINAADPLESQSLVAGQAIGSAAGHHPLLLDGGKMHHHSQQHPQQHHLHHLKHPQQQQPMHLSGDDGQATMAMGLGIGYGIGSTSAQQGQHRFGGGFGFGSGPASGSGSVRHRGLSLLVILLLFLMLALNVILLLKLWKLEERIDVDLSRRARLPSLAALKELPNTNQEWLELLRDQEIAHENELDKWQQVLQTAIELLKKVSIVCEKIYNDGQLRQRIESMSRAVHSEF